MIMYRNVKTFLKFFFCFLNRMNMVNIAGFFNIECNSAYIIMYTNHMKMVNIAYYFTFLWYWVSKNYLLNNNNIYIHDNI